MPVLLTEARPVAEASPVEGQPGRFLLQLISPGWGASGYYSQEVLEAAAAAAVFPAGLHAYVDHPRGDGARLDERGNRSVLDLAAVLSENARWDGNALVAEATVFGPYREVLAQMRESIGISVRAYAEVMQGTAEGKHGQIVSELVEGVSADFVTRAGRGGRIVDVIESARPSQVNARAVRRGISEATANDTREALQDALREAYGAEKSWVWVRDFEETDEGNTVWYEHDTPDESGTYAEGYTLAESGAVTLAGERVEVRPHTEYVPVEATSTTATEGNKNVTATRPDSNTPTTKSKENPMGMIEVDEAEHRQVTEKAGRVDTLESERDTEKQRADTAEAERDTLKAEKAESARATRAAEIVKESAATAKVTFTALEAKGLTADLPLKEDGTLDEAAFTTSVDEAVKTKADESGAGRPRGFGQTTTTDQDEVTESSVTDMIRRRAGISEQKGA